MLPPLETLSLVCDVAWRCNMNNVHRRQWARTSFTKNSGRKSNRTEILNREHLYFWNWVVLRSMLFSYFVYVNKLTDALLGSGYSSFPLFFVILAAHGYKEDWTGIVTTIVQTAIVLTKRGYLYIMVSLVFTATGFLQFIFLSPEATVVDLLCVVTKRVGLN